MDAPDIVFPKDFQHIHVYESGDVCLPILESQYWKPRSSMGELIKRTINLIHQEINPYSPANQTLYTMYKMDR
jgi:ubiquitin-protein ligase